MAAGFFKKNEKLFLTILLLILAPSFAFTGLMMNALNTSNPDLFEVFGKTVDASEFQKLRGRVGLLSGRRGANEEQVLRYVMQCHEADRLGIEISDEELAAEVKVAGRQMISQMKYQQQVAANPALAQTLRPQPAPFKREDYYAALDLIGMSAPEYEEMLRENLRLGKVAELVVGSPVISEKELYDVYEEQEHKRSFDLVRIPSEDFMEKVKAEITDADLLERFNEGPVEFRLPRQIKLEALKVNLTQLNINQSFTDEELKARYETDKTSLYLTSESFNLKPEEQEYKPFEEVKATVLFHMRREAATARQKEVFEAALAEAQKRKDASQTEYPLMELVADAGVREHMEVIETDFFSRDKISDLPRKIGNAARLGALFATYVTLEEGAVATEVVPMIDGDFIYRVIAKKDDREPASMDECRDKVLEKLAESRAQEAAGELAQTWSDKISATENPTTLEALAQESNYTVHGIDASGTREANAKVKIDGKAVSGAYQIVQEVFQVDEPGELGTPVDSFDRKFVYVVRLTAIVPANSAGFEAVKERLANTIRQRKQTAAIETYLSDLRRRAKIRDLRPPVEEDLDDLEDLDDEDTGEPTE